MEDNKDIISVLMLKLDFKGIWFTTKQDPTFIEPDYFYELDEYGDLSEKGIEKVCKDILAFIGDGASDLDEAIEMWIENNLMVGTISYKEYLRTKFKPKQVVDNIEAYENSQQWEVKTESRIKLAKSLREASLTKIPAELKRTKPMPEFTDNDWAKYFDEYVDSRLAIYEADGDYNLEFLKRESEKMGLNGEFTEKSFKDDIEEMGVVYANRKEKEYNNVKDEFNKQFKNIKTENRKSRLEEENNTSANLISSKFTDKDFDSNSKEGQIVMRTSELFNVLSDKGYDVQVSFDNGESQNAILLGEQGGKVMITITNTDTPLRAFASGNFELTNDNLDTLRAINSEISSL